MFLGPDRSAVRAQKGPGPGPDRTLKHYLFVNLIDVELQQWIENSDAMDKDATDALTTLLNQGSNAIGDQLNEWTMEKFNGRHILFFKEKNYVPQNKELRWDILKMFHDHETAGHPGELETFNSVKHHYWWPGIRTFVKPMSKDAEFANNSKLIDTHQNQVSYLPKGPEPPD